MKTLGSEHIRKLNYMLLSKKNSHHSAVRLIRHSPLSIRVSLKSQLFLLSVGKQSTTIVPEGTLIIWHLISFCIQIYYFSNYYSAGIWIYEGFILHIYLWHIFFTFLKCKSTCTALLMTLGDFKGSAIFSILYG
jgi:hypothetical protein